MNPSRDGAALTTRCVMPIVAGGRVFVGGKRVVDEYGLLDTRPPMAPAVNGAGRQVGAY
jgi:hypothetical protein